MKIRYPDVLAFTVGLVIMGTELTATRFIAPYFGTSIFVWTNVIAVIMIALSLGYWAGGKLVARGAPLRDLQIRLVMGAVALGAIPFVAAPLAKVFLVDVTRVSSGSFALFLGSFLLVTVLFLIPSFLFAMTSPYLIGYYAKHGKDPGLSAGRISAIATVGSIIGTFLPTMVLIPTIGSKRTIFVFAGMLLFLTLPPLLKNKKILNSILILPLLLPFVANSSLRDVPTLISETESAYQYIQVYEENGERRLVFNEGGGFQSVYRPGEILTGETYFETMALMPSFIPKQEIDILILGLAGGTIARQIDLLYPEDIQMTGVEIDPKVIEQARKYFDLDRDSLEVVNMDARAFLHLNDVTYDIIMIDAYSSQIYIPSHLVTQEFFKDVQEHLNPGGIVAFNINATGDDSELLRVFTNTVTSVFPYVYRAPLPRYWNHIVIASNEPLVEAQNIPLELSSVASMILPLFEPKVHDKSEKVFTDDWAPTEWMTDKMIFKYLSESAI